MLVHPSCIILSDQVLLPEIKLIPKISHCSKTSGECFQSAVPFRLWHGGTFYTISQLYLYALSAIIMAQIQCLLHHCTLVLAILAKNTTACASAGQRVCPELEKARRSWHSRSTRVHIMQARRRRRRRGRTRCRVGQRRGRRRSRRRRRRGPR